MGREGHYVIAPKRLDDHQNSLKSVLEREGEISLTCMRMRSLILYVISCYGVYKCVCFCTMISWCSVKASAAIQNSPRSPRNVTRVCVWNQGILVIIRVETAVSILLWVCPCAM